MPKTKIVCTIGPCSCDKKSLENLISAGMSVARLNGSHNTLEWHSQVIHRLRSANKNIPILFDLPGRKIRTKKYEGAYKFNKGQTIVFTSDQNYAGKEKIPVNYDGFHKDLKKGNTILADDGTLKFQVESIKGKDIFCKALVSGALKSAKGLNVPYIKVNTPLVTEPDKKLIKFAIKHKVDWVGVSFVESGEHVKKVKSLLGKSGIGVISKTENQFAVDNLDSIIQESAGILVDRGDLGAETRVEHIGLLQKEIIAKANIFGKPVIVATEMLHSMIENPHPTKAEVVDISNAILDGASAIMLSGETAAGKNPVSAVKLMRSVANEVEAKYSQFNKLEITLKHLTIPNAIGKSIYEICKEMPINKIVCITLSGYAANMISRYRLNKPILAVTDSLPKARSFNLLWGVEGLHLNIHFNKKNVNHIVKAAEKLWRMGKLQDSELVVFTAVLFPQKGNRMNFLGIHKIGDLHNLFGWEKSFR